MSRTPPSGTYRWSVTVKIGFSSMDLSGTYETDGRKSLDSIREEIRQYCGEELSRQARMEYYDLSLASLTRFNFTAA